MHTSTYMYIHINAHVHLVVSVCVLGNYNCVALGIRMGPSVIVVYTFHSPSYMEWQVAKSLHTDGNGRHGRVPSM